MAETVFKNVQVLRGIPVDEFMDTMGMFSAALGYDCASCHGADISTNREAFAEATASIQRARQMVLMTNAINRANFGGTPRVSCFTCHRGQVKPENPPNLALQYAAYVEDPNTMAIIPDRRGSAAEVLDRYIRAIGGAQRLAALTSFVATGTYVGFNTGGNEMPIEIAAAAPDRRVQVVKSPDGDAARGYDGREAWAAEPWRPLPVMTLSGGNRETARLEAALSFPLGIREMFDSWIVGSTSIDDKPVRVLQGSSPGDLPVNFYFDESDLLIRVVRWNRVPVGMVPIQVDYSDYREVSGVRIPFRSVVTWTDGQNTIELKEIQPNVAVDPTRFAKPAALTSRTPR